MKRVLLSVLLVVLMLLSMTAVAAAEGESVDEATIDAGLEPGMIMAVKAAWGLRLRAAAGFGGRVRLVLKCGEQVKLGSGEVITEDGLEWVEVEVTRDEVATVGYVALKYLTEDLTPNCYLWAPGPYVRPPCPRPPRPPCPPPLPPQGGDFPGGGATEGIFPGGGATGGVFPGVGAK